ncbi:hypothetical protein [Vibrio metschnikovii]|uniref:Uncharacterized protein n=1 Tax=Vibrio metschnikovii TaxID=28172 RepID=A0A9X0UIR2_VIBME|nr:hypothetical protein [Vibrio metschnikovii]MBC5852155.1 hypothetical protein [Vibrio metschnikovii]
MIELSPELDIKGKVVTFTESTGENEYDIHSGKDVRVVEIYLDHKTCKENGDCDPITLPMIKVELVDDPSITFNAWSDEVGNHKVIDIFHAGIQAAQPLYDSYVGVPGLPGYDPEKVKSLEDYTMEAEKLNPYQKGSCEHKVFKKGFESMYFK